MDEVLQKYYYDPKYGFTNVNNFHAKLKEMGYKYTKKQVNEWYKKQTVNQIYNKSQPKTRSSIIAFNAGECLQADLMDISKFKFKNSHYTFLLNVVDVYSRYVWSFPIKQKKAINIAPLLKQVYEEVKQIHPTFNGTLTTDTGNEFTNDAVKKLNKEYNRKHYTIVSADQNHPTITAIVERFNYTLWNLISKYTESVDNLNFIKVLPELIENYNNTKHTTIKAKPIDVFYKKDLPNMDLKISNVFKIGDYVRAKLHKKKVGAKAYDIKYTDVIYEVYKVEGTTHYLKNIETNRKSNMKYQYTDLLKIPNETINKEINNKKLELDEITKNNKTKRTLTREGLNVDKTQEKPTVFLNKRDIPTNNKRVRKPVVKYGEYTK